MSSTAALRAQYDLHTRLFNNALAGITDSESTTRHSEHLNHIKFIAGHLLNTRVSFFTQITGGQPDTSYAALFARGAKIEPGAQYPSIEEIVARWNTTAGVGEALTHIPEEVLDSKSARPAPIADDTVRGLIAFLISHESYHIGQLALLRKMAGKEAMSYN